MWENQGMTKRCQFNLYQIKLAAAQLNTSLRPEIQTLKLLRGYISNPVRLSQTVPKASLQEKQACTEGCSLIEHVTKKCSNIACSQAIRLIKIIQTRKEEKIWAYFQDYWEMQGL